MPRFWKVFFIIEPIASLVLQTVNSLFSLKSSNDFEEYGSISFLFICPKLENLVLKGNPISYEVEYRPTIFRILPGLKNLDVIMMKRVPKTICKKDKSPNEDDDNEGTASNGIPQQDSDLRELESKI